MAVPRITLYVTGNCAYCRQARQYLQQRGLRFQELNIHHSTRAQKALAQMGARSVPVIMIGDTRIDGFDRKRLDAVLKKVVGT